MLRLSSRLARSMTRVINSMPEIIVPARIIFNGYPYSTSYRDELFIDAPEFWKKNSNIYENKLPSFENLINLLDNNNENERKVIALLTKENQYLKFHGNIIDSAINKIKDEKKKIKIRDDIINETIFHGSSDWVITDITEKYNVSGFEVCCALILGSKPFQMGVFSHDEKFNKEVLKEIFDSRIEKDCDKVYFDYINGVGVKNGFPIKSGVHFSLNMKKYNERNGWTGYEKIIALLASKC